MMQWTELLSAYGDSVQSDVDFRPVIERHGEELSALSPV